MQKNASKMTSNDSFLNICMFMHDNINFFWERIMKNEKKKIVGHSFNDFIS